MTEEKPRKLRWIMIGLVFLATVINYLDRQTLSVLAPTLREEFGMSNVVYSRVTFAFMLAYTIANGISGPLIDRLGTRRGYALVMLLWSSAAMMHALARNAWMLGGFRFLLGLGEAGNWPGGVKVVAEWFPARERALASGIFNSGAAIGAILAPPLIVWLALAYGWPSAFVMVGGVGFLWLIVWWVIYYTPAETQVEAITFSWRQLLRHPFVQRFTLAKIFLDPVWYFYIFWFPEYLKRERGFDLASIGKYAWIPFVAADIGNLIGGLISARLIARGVSVTNARKGAVTFFAGLMLCSIPAVMVTDVRLSIGLVSLAMLGYTGSTANMLAFPADVFPKSAVGAVYGFASMGSGFGGMVFTLITGWTLDHYSYTPVFIGFGLLPLICASILWFLLGPLEPSGERGVQPLSSAATL
jgi:ACS family hexuronate transporter-like MFS transporter